jgi:hypothetical protein
MQAIWSKNGVALQTSRTLKLTFTADGWCELRTTADDTTAAGVYVCAARNSLGNDSTQSTVVVLAESSTVSVAKAAGNMLNITYLNVTTCGIAPAALALREHRARFVRAPARRLVLVEGEAMLWACEAVGEMTLTYSWLKDGLVVSVFGCCFFVTPLLEHTCTFVPTLSS